MNACEKQETLNFLRQRHVEELKKHASFVEKLIGKPFKAGCLRVEFMDGTSEDFGINPDDDPDEIVKFVGALSVNRVRNLKQLIKEFK